MAQSPACNKLPPGSPFVASRLKEAPGIASMTSFTGVDLCAGDAKIPASETDVHIHHHCTRYPALRAGTLALPGFIFC
ncbi:hypothetical protein AD24_4785 [Escherichia coli 2-011-08_S4_C3]|nr:hypothetical protein AC66_2839 [Escherichia coli 2-011-08_S4_C1]KDT11122.1 hypothetical protein AD24_4785 [Escherichia coli 2-011-08_S4_C3]